MGVWGFLALWVDAGPFMSNDIGRFPQPTILPYGKNRHTPSGVMCHEDRLSFPIHNEVTWALSARWLLVQKGQFSCLRVSAESAHSSTWFAGRPRNLADRIEVTFGGVKSQE
jgi:hypothetical protein